MDRFAWLAFLHTAMFCIAMAYAKFLNQEWVYTWYSPDHVWMTVVGGDILIWPFITAIYWLGFPWWATAVFYITLHIAAGLPIIHWQRQRKAKRRRDLEEINRTVEERT